MTTTVGHPLDRLMPYDILYQVKYRYIQPRKKRRSTIEVHPSFSKAPHFRSAIPHPKTDFRTNQNASRQIIPWPKSTIRFFFSKSRLTFRRMEVKETRLAEKKIAKMCSTFIVERVGNTADCTALTRKQELENTYQVSERAYRAGIYRLS